MILAWTELSYSQTDCVNVKSVPGMILAWTELSYSQTDCVNLKSVPGMILNVPLDGLIRHVLLQVKYNCGPYLLFHPKYWSIPN